jgi:small subunit ribosomal protein S5
MRKQPRRQRAEDFGGEFEEKVLYINRCATVTKGGRKFSFSALILIGDGQGHVGYGFAKANEVSDAIRKGTEAARKNVFTIQMHGTTIPHELYVEWDGARIVLKPASSGTGIVAGSKVRAVFELAGVKDVIAKNIGSSNPLNQVKAMFKAINELKTREQRLEERKGVAV